MRDFSRTSPRPGGVTALGVINIIIGCLLLGCNACDGFFGLALVVGDDQGNRLLQDFLIHQTPARNYIFFGAVFFGFIEGAVLIIIGIGLLALQNWARLMAISFTAVALLAHVARPVYELAVFRPALDHFIQNNNVAFAGPELRGVFMFFTMIHVVADALLFLYWVILLLVLLNHVNSRAFAGHGAPRDDDAGGRALEDGASEWRPARYRPEPPPRREDDDERYRR